jgi:ssDNA-binding Zn-finger/Zn-ribbon topoisomerase 1
VTTPHGSRARGFWNDAGVSHTDRSVHAHKRDKLKATHGESVMAQAEETSITRRCPRCGGLMKKLPGSSLYWHADNNHPRCDITNIVDTPMTVQTSDEPLEQPDQPPKGKNRKK